MTFDEKRTDLLHRFDEQVKELRKIAGDPTWTNDGYQPYREVLEKISKSVRDLLTLNQTEQL